MAVLLDDHPHALLCGAGTEPDTASDLPRLRSLDAATRRQLAELLDNATSFSPPDSQVIMARVGDDVAFGCENLGVPREQIWPRVREALDAVGLAVPLEHPTEALSGGQKQRLALACAST